MSSSPNAETQTLLRSLQRALTFSYKIIVRLTSVLKSKNLSNGFPIVLKTIQLMSATAIGPKLLIIKPCCLLRTPSITTHLAQLAQLGAGFGYFPGFCIA